MRRLVQAGPAGRGRAILAAVDGNPTLARVRNLLKDLPGEAGNAGQMYAWADPGDADSMPEHVWGLIAGAMRNCCPGLIPAGAGVSDAAHKPPLAEVDETAGTRTDVYPGRRPSHDLQGR